MGAVEFLYVESLKLGDVTHAEIHGHMLTVVEQALPVRTTTTCLASVDREGLIAMNIGVGAIWLTRNLYTRYWDMRP